MVSFLLERRSGAGSDGLTLAVHDVEGDSKKINTWTIGTDGEEARRNIGFSFSHRFTAFSSQRNN